MGLHLVERIEDTGTFRCGKCGKTVRAIGDKPRRAYETWVENLDMSLFNVEPSKDVPFLAPFAGWQWCRRSVPAFDPARAPTA
eukprot:2165329-Amphidinium_carterae.1